MPDVSVVILTMGDRPEELAAAIASARAQQGVVIEIILVVNGGDPDRSLADVIVEPGKNLGIPGGRNAGAAAATAGFILFLDDDGELLGPSALKRATTVMAERKDVAIVGLCIVDEQGRTARRHHPALRGDPTVSSDVTSFPGGACVVRSRAFIEAGGLCAEFFYGLEETDLAWRLMDRGWVISYAADSRMRHPATNPARHRLFFHATARNRVWLAHRLLPAPLAIGYITNWTILTILRNIQHPSALRAHMTGTIAGLRAPIGPRNTIRWRTTARMLRLGRPPVI